MPLKLFNMAAFAAALDVARRAKGLSWPELAVDINRPFEGTPSIPINPGTLRTMTAKRSVTSAVVLQVLAWLGRTPESFLVGNAYDPRPDEKLPDAGPGRVLRLNTRALHTELDRQRRERNLTWKEVAEQLPGFTPSMLTNLATGPLIGFPRVMHLTQWMERPAASFVRVVCR